MTMRRPSLLAAFAAFAVLGCGGDPQPIASGTADRLQADLDAVAASIDAERCGPARAQLERLRRDAGNVSDTVDGDVRQTLDDGVDHLGDLVEQECEAISSSREEETTSTTEPETTTSTTTTEPATTTSTTTEPAAPTTTAPETPAPTTPETPPPGQGQDGGAEDGDSGDAGAIDRAKGPATGGAEAPGGGA